MKRGEGLAIVAVVVVVGIATIAAVVATPNAMATSPNYTCNITDIKHSSTGPVLSTTFLYCANGEVIPLGNANYVFALGHTYQLWTDTTTFVGALGLDSVIELPQSYGNVVVISTHPFPYGASTDYSIVLKNPDGTYTHYNTTCSGFSVGDSIQSSNTAGNWHPVDIECFGVGN